MNFMKPNFNLFHIPLQFFASDLTSTEVDTVDSGAASPTEPKGADETSAADINGNRLEEEFESLIKGGKYEDAFKKRTQGIIDKRFKTLKSLEDLTAKQQPIIDLLSAKYGIDPSDPALLLQKLQTEQADTADGEKDNAEMRDLKKREEFVTERARELSRRWTREGEALKKLFPSFSFQNELKNPLFASLLKSGVPLQKAYTAAHSDELIRNAVSGTAKRVAEQSLKSIRANGSRVAENGLHNGAGIIRKTDVSSLTGKEIRSILKQVENGSKIRF